MPSKSNSQNSYDWQKVIEDLKNSPAVSQEDFLQSSMTDPNFNASPEFVEKLRDLSNQLRGADEKGKTILFPGWDAESDTEESFLIRKAATAILNPDLSSDEGSRVPPKALAALLHYIADMME
jgi:hypothetical protein